MNVTTVLAKLMLEGVRRGVVFGWNHEVLIVRTSVWHKMVYLPEWVAKQPPEVLSGLSLEQLVDFGATENQTVHNQREYDCLVLTGETKSCQYAGELENVLKQYLRHLPAQPRRTESGNSEPAKPSLFTEASLQCMLQWIADGWRLRMSPTRLQFELDALDVIVPTALRMHRKIRLASDNYDLLVETYHMKHGRAPHESDVKMLEQPDCPARTAWMRNALHIQYARLPEGMPWMVMKCPDVSFLGQRVDIARHGYCVEGSISIEDWLASVAANQL